MLLWTKKTLVVRKTLCSSQKILKKWKGYHSTIFSQEQALGLFHEKWQNSHQFRGPKKTKRSPLGLDKFRIFILIFAEISGTLLVFLTSIVAKHRKIERGPFGEFFPKKSLTMLKKIGRGDPLVSPNTVRYAEKLGKSFLVQFARPNASIWHHRIS